jgi:adenosylcobyric acid synthase
MKVLLSSGIGQKIIIEAKKGIPVIGICGGYQMLGTEIIDSGVEGTGGADSIQGLGLLNVTTRFEKYEKQTRQAEKPVTGDGRILGPIKGQDVRGYEIHMGKTEGGDPAFGDDGSVNENGIIIGTYLHGLFENDNFRNSFLSYLYDQKGLIYEPKTQSDGIEELAEFIGSHLDMDSISRMLEE